VALGPDHPIWKKLYEALGKLAEVCGGPFAFVIDEGNGLWCVGLSNTPATTATGGKRSSLQPESRDDCAECLRFHRYDPTV
jgi:hypothetical protein